MKGMQKTTSKNIVETIDSSVANKIGEKRVKILKEGIEILSKERTAHLTVTMFVSLFMIIFFSLSMFLMQKLIFVLFFITLILSCFYIWHYFFLENSISRLYNSYLEALDDENR